MRSREGQSNIDEIKNQSNNQIDNNDLVTEDKEAGEKYREIIAKEVEDHNVKRTMLRKIFLLKKQTPESRIAYEGSLRDVLVDQINNSERRESRHNDIPYDIGKIYEQMMKGTIEDPEGVFLFEEKGADITKNDGAMVKRVLDSPEVRDSFLEKCEDILLSNKKVEYNNSSVILAAYMEAAGDNIPPRMIDIILKSDHYNAENIFKNLYKKAGFKKWFNQDEVQDSLLDSNVLQEIILAYDKTLLDDGPPYDNFFESEECRDSFLISAIGKDEHIFGSYQTKNILEKVGIYDNPDAYRSFMQNAKTANTIYKTYSDIKYIKKDHEAVSTLTDTEELKSASIEVVIAIGHENMWENEFSEKQKKELAPIFFDKLYNYFKNAERLNDIFSDFNYHGPKNPQLNGAGQGLEVMKFLLDQTERPDDKIRLFEVGNFVMNLCRDRFDSQAVIDGWKNNSPNQAFNIDEVFKLAKNAARLNGNSDDEELLNNYLDTTLRQAMKMIDEDFDMIARHNFESQVVSLCDLSGYKDAPVTGNEMGELSNDQKDMIIFYSKYSQGNSGYGSHTVGQKTHGSVIYDNFSVFNSVEGFTKGKAFLDKYVSKMHSLEIDDIYFRLCREGDKSHDEIRNIIDATVQQLNDIDSELLRQPWMSNIFRNADAIKLIKGLYEKYGNKLGLEYAKESAKGAERDNEIFTDPETIDFFEVVNNHGLPVDILLRKGYVESRRNNNEKKWLERISTVVDTMNKGGELSKEDKGNTDYMALVKMVYPDSNYSDYEANAKLTDKNEDIEHLIINSEGYKMKMSGVIGYERTEPESPGALESYQTRIHDIYRISARSEEDERSLNNKIKSMIEKAELQNIIKEPKNSDEYGVLVLALLNDHMNRKSNSVETVFTDQELADLSIAYHLRGIGEQFVQESQDDVKSTTDQTTKDYIQWDSLARVYVEEGKQTLSDLYDSLRKNDEGKEYLQDLGERFSSDETISTEDINQGLTKVSEELTATLARVPDSNRHRNVTIKKLKQFTNNLFQTQLKSLSKDEKHETIEIINSYIEEELVPETGDLLSKLDDESVSVRLQQIIQEKSFHPLKAVDQVLEQDAIDIKKEVSAYKVNVEKDEKNGKSVDKQQKNRTIIGYISKSAEVSNARATARVCIATDTEMWDNKNYFEFVMFNEETKQCEGTVMLLTIEEAGKKHLLYCPNPSEKLVSQISFEDCYNKITSHITTFANENGYDSIIASSSTSGRATNRTGGFAATMKKSYLQDEAGRTEVLKLKKKYKLGGGYEYGGDDTLHYVWKK